MANVDTARAHLHGVKNQVQGGAQAADWASLAALAAPELDADADEFIFFCSGFKSQWFAAVLLLKAFSHLMILMAPGSLGLLAFGSLEHWIFGHPSHL